MSRPSAQKWLECNRLGHYTAQYVPRCEVFEGASIYVSSVLGDINTHRELFGALAAREPTLWQPEAVDGTTLYVSLPPTLPSEPRPT